MKEEPVDILDKQGKPTGQTLLKSEAHKQGLWHGGAHIWIYNSKGEVLLQLRSPKKIIRPNIWDVSVAGHIPAGKTALETAVEEAQEELGLEVDSAKLEFLANSVYEDIQEPGHWHHRVHLRIYALRLDELDLSKLKLEESETAAVKWLPLEQLKKDLDDPKMANKYAPTRHSYDEAIAKIPKLLETKP